MNVGELIEMLKSHPPELRVVINSDECTMRFLHPKHINKVTSVITGDALLLGVSPGVTSAPGERVDNAG